MKWPNTLAFIRHGESAYNVLKSNKHTETYLKFQKQFEKEFAAAKEENWASPELSRMARHLWNNFRLNVSDYNTPLTKEGFRQAKVTGQKLLKHVPKPDVIYVSPYLRTRETLRGIIEGCPGLKGVKAASEERLREQEHGLSTVYNDWRIYFTLNPVQALLFKLEGDYEYRFLNGENKADVRGRVRSFLATLIRENSGQNVLVVSHHLTLLSMMANLERWDREKFIKTDRTERPINCGLTIYKGDPSRGKEGRLMLKSYNKKLY